MNMLNENKERNISDKIIINESILKDGDIILTSENSFRSNVIKYVTNSNYSHAIMMINKTAYIHAISSGIQSGNIQRLMFNNEDEFCILRLKDYDQQQCKIRKACNFMIGEIDRYYSILNAMLAPLHISFPLGNNDIGRYCSQLIALAYEKSEIPLLDNPNCTPQDLFTSDKLEHIKIQTQKISEMNSLKKKNYSSMTLLLPMII